VISIQGSRSFHSNEAVKDIPHRDLIGLNHRRRIFMLDHHTFKAGEIIVLTVGPR